MSTSPTFYPALHALRGWAALWVVLMHLWFFTGQADHWFAGFLHMGWSGVYVLYALSAFLFGLLYLDKPLRDAAGLRRFYRKRLLRVLPAYYVQLILILCLTFTGVWTLPGGVDLFNHLWLFFNLPPAQTQPLNGVWWTLTVELEFYLVLPLLLWFIRRWGIMAFAWLCLGVTLSYRWYLFHVLGLTGAGYFASYGHLPGVLTTFGAGLIAAWWVTHQTLVGRSGWLLLSALAGMAGCGWWLLNEPTYWEAGNLLMYWDTLYAVFLGLLLLALFNSTHGFINHRLFLWQGEISYGIYLWHLPLILLFSQQPRSFLSLFVLVVPLTYLLAHLSYQWVEQRFHRLPGKPQ
jgi:peptidoglycan/LPS O-acetylase OafA/YrhL